jgi:hypothetical protein
MGIAFAILRPGHDVMDLCPLFGAEKTFPLIAFHYSRPEILVHHVSQIKMCVGWFDVEGSVLIQVSVPMSCEK